MAGKKVDTEARDNLQPWLTSLRKPGIDKDDMLKVYSDWVEKANYDTVSSHMSRLVTKPTK